MSISKFISQDDTHYFLLAALEATPASVTIADARHPDRPLVYVNAAFTRTTGYSAEEVLGRNCRFLQGAETDLADIERMRAALARAEPIELEILNYRKTGEAFWNALVITPVKDASGATTAFVGLQFDVTSQRRDIERTHQDAKMQALGTLAGGVAHEINNLLQPMLTFPELIAPALPEEADEEREWLALIEEHAHAARAVVRSILAFSHKESPSLGPVDAKEALERAVASIEATLPPGVRLERTGSLVDGSALGTIIAGPTLGRAIANLAANAVHAMGNSGMLTIGAERNGDLVSISVSDTGCGMDEEVRRRIFEPFFTTKALGEGTGLGLALVHADVGRWGGQIEVTSAPGKGTRFTIILPVLAKARRHAA